MLVPYAGLRGRFQPPGGSCQGYRAWYNPKSGRLFGELDEWQKHCLSSELNSLYPSCLHVYFKQTSRQCAGNKAVWREEVYLPVLGATAGWTEEMPVLTLSACPYWFWMVFVIKHKQTDRCMANWGGICRGYNNGGGVWCTVGATVLTEGGFRGCYYPSTSRISKTFRFMIKTFQTMVW